MLSSGFSFIMAAPASSARKRRENILEFSKKPLWSEGLLVLGFANLVTIALIFVEASRHFDQSRTISRLSGASGRRGRLAGEPDEICVLRAGLDVISFFR